MRNGLREAQNIEEKRGRMGRGGKNRGGEKKRG